MESKSTLIILDSSVFSRDILNELKNPKYKLEKSFYIGVTDRDFALEIKADKDLKDFVKSVTLIEDISLKGLTKFAKNLERYNVNKVALLNLNYESSRTELNDQITFDKLESDFLNLSILMGEVFKDQVIKVRGEIILGLYYYQSEVRASNGLHSAFTSAIDRYFRSLNKEIAPNYAKVTTYALKAPSEYSLVKYERVVEMLVRDLI